MKITIITIVFFITISFVTAFLILHIIHDPYKESNQSMYDRYNDSVKRYNFLRYCAVIHSIVKHINKDDVTDCYDHNEHYYIHLRDSIDRVIHPPFVPTPIDTICYPLKP